MAKTFDPTATPNPGGRRSKLTEELTVRMRELVLAGNYIEVAAAACGITAASYYKWIRNANELVAEWGDDPQEWPDEVTEHQVMCYKFASTMKQAVAESEAYAVSTVRKHMTTNWQAAMTYLERRHPGRWKRRDELTVGSPFELGGAESSIDEQALLNDPEAARLIHEALMHVAAPEQLESGDVVDAEVVDDDDDDDATGAMVPA